MSGYRQLSAEERVKIEPLAGEEHSLKSIAQRLGHAQSTISREMSRNRVGVSHTERRGRERSRRAAGRRPRSVRAGCSRRTGNGSMRAWRKAGAGLIPRRVDIGLRPKVVAEKSRSGDPEVDLIIGKGHHGAVLTVVDRNGKYAWLVPLTGKTAAETTRELIRLLEPLKGRMRTITTDNGKEFAGHAEVPLHWIWTTTSRGHAACGSGV